MFLELLTIPGTHKFHSFVPQFKDVIRVRPYLFSTAFKEEKGTKQERKFETEEISEFVTCEYDGQW